MPLTFYNSLTRQKEIFQPVAAEGASSPPDSSVKLYVCGPTVYDFAHIGNARAMIVFDVLFRLLKQNFPCVVYVRNMTDVDDKIIAASQAAKVAPSEISLKFETAFLQDMASLNVLPPTHSPRATEFIPQMIAVIQRLLANYCAYEAEGHVLFSVEAFPRYGQLSRKSQEDLIAGARVDVAPYKKNPADFVLWKPSPPNFPGWESPWGRGRPGWHIECSAMSAHYLGETFDIHAGGIDLIFPHHENERAQSCCAFGVPEMTRFWMHNGHLTVEGQKMSKSLENFITVRSLLAQVNPEVIRLALLSAHYRQPLHWTDKVVVATQQLLNRWYRALATFPLDEETPARFTDLSEEAQAFLAPFQKALEEDMNTPLAMQQLTKLVQALEKNPTKTLAEALVWGGHQLGVLYQSAETWFQGGRTPNDEGDATIQEQIDARNKARAEKDFLQADCIRENLLKQGIALEDSSEGTTWRRLS
ncbi:cysteine--tRNA ligase [Alphaproteobacteria bacterium]|nr:cysteine--tRNA ligase [Alphaproteobacteria bacterium]